MSWFEQVHAAGVATVAQALGFQVFGRNLRPCPKCGAKSRSRSDTRGCVGITSDGRGWRCWVCKKGGDGVALAALAITGNVRPDPAGWSRVEGRLAAEGICTAGPGDRAAAAAGGRPAGPAPTPTRLAADEVAALWGACQSVRSDTASLHWLAGRPRPISATLVAHFDLARVLPPSAALPPWAVYRGRPWTDSHRLIVPMHDEYGRLRSLHARSVTACASRDKAANPKGAEMRGLVMADAGGLLLLKERFLDGELWIVEGVPDFLDLALDVSAGPVRAVIGVINGSWKADSLELAARIPKGARVVLATHRDADGEKYAEWIARSFGDRVLLRRWVPFTGRPGDGSVDINAVGRRGGRLIPFGRARLDAA